MSTLFPISETFVSLQGEGNYVGRRAFFVRMQYCNLTCSWCDSKYTWYQKSGHHEWLTAENIKKKIKQSNAKHVVFTGGEPTLFDLSEFVLEGVQSHIESNGTYIPTEPLEITLNDGTKIKREAIKQSTVEQFNWVISPKLSNAGQKVIDRSIIYWSDSNCFFKFIVKNTHDVEEVEIFVDKFHLDPERVFLSLEGITRKSQLNRDLVEKILNRGFHYSPRLHILLWNGERKR